MPPPSNQNENQGLKIAVACLAIDEVGVVLAELSARLLDALLELLVELLVIRAKRGVGDLQPRPLDRVSHWCWASSCRRQSLLREGWASATAEWPEIAGRSAVGSPGRNSDHSAWCADSDHIRPQPEVPAG